MEGNRHIDNLESLTVWTGNTSLFSPKIHHPILLFFGRVMDNWLRESGEIDIETLAMVNWKVRKACLLFMFGYWNISLILLSFAYQSLFDHLPHSPKKVAN